MKSLVAFLSLTVIVLTCLSWRQISTTRISTHQLRQQGIPNIVHFVYAVNNESSAIVLNFADWLAVHSAVYHQQPEQIYLHTNSKATLNGEYGSKWTALVLGYPRVKVMYLSPPRVATNGKRIDRLINWSDFFRTAAMVKYGGIYLDFDMYIVRSLKPLMSTPFNTVVGTQINGRVACGLWLSQPNSKFGQLYNRLQYDAFDGQWDTHAIELINYLARQLPGEVLILEQTMFFPYGWQKDQLQQLMGDSKETKQDLTKLPKDWRKRIDPLANSFAVHGFNSGAKKHKFPALTPEYIDKRGSRFARAVYDAYKDGVVYFSS